MNECQKCVCSSCENKNICTMNKHCIDYDEPHYFCRDYIQEKSNLNVNTRRDIMKEDLIKSANLIKEFCSDYGITHEDECPFFRGYEEKEDVKIVKCELNKGECSPCNWKL